MNKAFKIIRAITCFGAVVLLAIGIASCGSIQSSRPILLQNYQIRASSDSTEVKAATYFRDALYGATLNVQPHNVKFNGTELEKALLPTYENLHAFENLLDENTRADFEKQFADGTPGYHGTISGFKERNVIEVVIPDNEVRTLALDLRPILLDRSKIFELSRSRSNVIEFTGGPAPGTFSLSVGISESGNKFDESLVRIDKEGRTITIPPEAFAKVANGAARLFAISGYSEYINEPDQSDPRNPRVIHYLSSYIFTYTDVVDVIVVD